MVWENAEASMSTPIRFYFQGRVHEISDVAPTPTVLQHLREDLHCTGTKEGCAEGDCGACTVVIGSPENGALTLKAVNSCIRFAATLDGCALFSVEDIQLVDGALHPVQQALVECHGSQCGFCTPGFVMSLWAMYLAQDGKPPSRCQIDDALSGNLCRCTGYRPIIDAARRMVELPPLPFDRAGLASKLASLWRDALATYSNSSSAGGQRFFAPRTIDELLQVRADHPQAQLLAGCTDVGLRVTKQLREIGAGATLDDAYRAVGRHYSVQLAGMWQRFALLPIRNAGTLGGNVANGSPIGDSMPWLIALGAELVLRDPSGVRVMALEDFYLGYKRTDLRPKEFVQTMRVPMPRAGVQFRTYKLAKCFDQDISALCAAFAFELDGDGDRDHIVNARIAFGGMAATPQRAARTEAMLTGRQWSEATLCVTMAMLADDFAPVSDMRACDTYRMQAAQNLLRRFWLETRADQPFGAHEVNVFAVRADEKIVAALT